MMQIRSCSIIDARINAIVARIPPNYQQQKQLMELLYNLVRRLMCFYISIYNLTMQKNNFIISWYCVVLIVANTTVCCIFKKLLHHFCHIWFILKDFT